MVRRNLGLPHRLISKNFNCVIWVKPTKKLAANQGLYNGFLAAGLIWSFFIENPEWQKNIQLFFLGCVIMAGIYGALSASKKIFFVQALPAILALTTVLLR